MKKTNKSQDKRSVKPASNQATKLEKKRKELQDPKIWEPMGLTSCHGKMFYRYRRLSDKKIGHLIIPETSSRQSKKLEQA